MTIFAHGMWHEVYADDDFGDSVRVRPWALIQDAKLGGRPRKQARVSAQHSGSDSVTDSESESSQGPPLDHNDATSSSGESDEEADGASLGDVDLDLDVGLGVGAVLFGGGA